MYSNNSVAAGPAEPKLFCPNIQFSPLTQFSDKNLDPDIFQIEYEYCEHLYKRIRHHL